MPKKKKQRPWTISKVKGNVHVLDLEHPGAAELVHTLWISDVHWDNPHCDRESLTRNLDEALARDAPIFIIGDFFCCMQGKYDRRANKADLRPEHQVADYFDALVNTAADFLEPYKNNLAVLTEGNHESAIVKYHETDLLDRLAYELRTRGGITTTGGYDGFIRIKLNYHNRRTSWVVYYHHGHGGGAPVTKGAINFNRMSEQVMADAFVTGHVHRRNQNDQLLMSLNANNDIVLRERDYIRLSTYKQDAMDGHGFAVERQMGPRPIGGYWCQIGRFETLTKPNNGRRDNWFRQWVKTI